MGVLTAAGSLARIMGPLLVSYVYNIFGLYFTYGIIGGSMATALVLLLVSYNRLVPLKLPTLTSSNPEEGKQNGNMTEKEMEAAYTMGQRKSVSSVSSLY